MATRDINQEIQQRIEAFTDELSQLVREAAVQAVQEALEGGATMAPAPSRARRRAAGKAPVRRRQTARGKRIRRSEAELAALGDKVLTHVRSNDGHRLEEIGAALGIPTAELKRPVANLLEAKALRTTGQRRGTKYHVGKTSASSRKNRAARKKK